MDQVMNQSSTHEGYISVNEELLEKLRVNKEQAFKHRRRRHTDWTENYTLYRDKVQLNRLTQRQSVNIPLIKSSIKTLLKDVDDPPTLYFSNLDNDDQAEVFFNTYWKYAGEKNNLALKDIQDKRQVMLFGRSFKSLNLIDGDFQFEIVDPQDVLVDRYVDPTDIDSARFLIHEHIYKPLSSLRTNPMFDNTAVRRLQAFLGTEAGLIKAEQNQLDWVEKQEREAALGVVDSFLPILGETYVELNKFFIYEFNEQSGRDEIQFIVTAEDMEVLYQAPLAEHIGKTEDNFWTNHFPYSTWADETERTDFWSDGVADTLRTLNKVLNSWFAQMVENRTLQNFGMNYFNASMMDEGFLPQTYEPVPWGWYPIPVGQGGKIGDSIMRVDVPDLSSTIEEINFIMQLAQQASAATTMQEGVKPETQQITLGEVQLLLKNAQERVKSMAVYYTASWEDFGRKYVKLLEAAPDLITETKITQKGRFSKSHYAKTITPKDWYSAQGYKIEVQMKVDMEEQTADELQKLQYAKALMPMNLVLDTIIKKKSLQFADLNSTEIAEVIKQDEKDQVQKQQMMAEQQMQQQQGQGQKQAPGAPGGQQKQLNAGQQPPVMQPMGAA